MKRQPLSLFGVMVCAGLEIGVSMIAFGLLLETSYLALHGLLFLAWFAITALLVGVATGRVTGED